ncbi:MFS transporter [Klugiella xanthotipulae]|uniref:Fucose permease n=1 Tax=Klugiella xanthotipulae TaxID=244735 RepID=A0A543I6X5_9MICO|nr:MFS transporter [Klugiella xanthotipulae]TQM66354.1 fucose permease [Klugiella xanthotipulae]
MPHPATSATPAASRHTTIGWRNGVFAVFALCGFGIANWLSRVPTVRDTLGASTSEMGVIILGIAIGSISGLLLSSHVVALLGPRRTIAVFLSSSVWGLPLAALAVAGDSALGAVVALALFGAGYSICDVAMNVSGAANERAIGRTIMPLFHALFSGGTVLGVATGTLAEVADLPILIHMLATAVLVSGGALLSVRYFPHNETAAHSTADTAEIALTWRDRLAVWTQPRTLLLGVIVLGMAWAEGSANDWLPLALVDGHGLDNALGAAVLGIFLAAMTVGRIVGGPLLDRFGRVAVLRTCAALAAVGLSIVIFVSVPWLVILGVVLWGLGASLGFPVGMSAAADDPRSAAATVSAVATIGYLAFLVGPPAIGFLGEHIGLLNALILVLVLIVLAGLASHAARTPAKTSSPG